MTSRDHARVLLGKARDDAAVVRKLDQALDRDGAAALVADLLAWAAAAVADPG